VVPPTASVASQSVLLHKNRLKCKPSNQLLLCSPVALAVLHCVQCSLYIMYSDTYVSITKQSRQYLHSNHIPQQSLSHALNSWYVCSRVISLSTWIAQHHS
jgi:hypothetical protein